MKGLTLGWQQRARVWFGGVPDEIKVCGDMLTHGQAAIAAATPRELSCSDERGERPGEDWMAVMVLKLARLQLDEMVDVLSTLLGRRVEEMASRDVGGVLEQRARRCLEPADLDAALYEVGAVLEGLELREALAGSIHVSHGFQVDGSISITTGPEIPETAITGLRGSLGGELEDEPDAIFRLAVSLTGTAASLYWALAPGSETPAEALPVRAAPEGVYQDRRQVAGPDDFVAASVLDQARSDLTFEQSLALSRLVLRHRGGPAATRGKMASMSISVARHLTKLGFAALQQMGDVEAVYDATGGQVKIVGSADRAQWFVVATEDGRELVNAALVRPVDSEHAATSNSDAPVRAHPPLDRQEFGQLELEIKRPNPTQDEVARAVRGLIQEAMTYRTGPEVLGLMKRVGRFTSLAPYNALLLDAQSPGCRHVLPAHSWRETWHRRVKPGERPHIILRTFGPVLLVFDVSQVEPIDDTAPALPKEVLDPFGMPPIADIDQVFARTAETAKVDGIRVTRTADGASSAGSATSTWSAGSLQIRKGQRSQMVEVPVTVDIEVNRGLDPTAAYITLAHELGHVYCGHIGTRDQRMWPDRRNLSEAAEECEAEAIAYIAGLRLDANVAMPPHLEQYLEPGSPVPPIDLEVVTKAAGVVLDLHEAPDLIWRRRDERAKKAQKNR